MNVEFHYYIIYFLSIRAGLPEDEALIIAYSSQFLDNNIIANTIDTGRDQYSTIVTQNYGWWDDSFPKNVYMPFHFFPGDPEYPGSSRMDGKKNPFSCTPNSPGVKELLIRALKTHNLYRIGIGLHTFADSWAHQNFSGNLENWNILDEGSFIPGIGHAQVLKTPDELELEWTDPRLAAPYSRISNRKRFGQAADKIYRYLCTYNRRPFDGAERVMEELFTRLIPPGRGKSLEESILDFIIETNIQNYDREEWLREAVYLDEDWPEEEIFTGYDKLLWLRNALLYRSTLLKKHSRRAKGDFYQSHFYHWNEAAKAHLQAAREIMGNVI